MDIPRVSEARKRRIRRIIYGTLAVLVIASVSFFIFRLNPAPPTVENGTVWPDTVKRGPMIRQVSGMGTLVPEEIRWIPAVTDGRIENILVHPGTFVKADTVIIEMVNPDQEQAAQEAQSQVETAEANLANLRARLESDLLSQQATAAQVAADYEQARLQAQADEQLLAQGLQSELTTKLSRARAEAAATRDQIEKKRVAQINESHRAQLQAQQTEVARVRAVLRLRQSQVNSLKVRPGTDGMLQEVGVEVGQRVGAGTNLARVANPTRLKAELKIPETLAKDLQIGQSVTIDTRNGLIPAHLSRIDPAVQGGFVTVDAALDGPLPKGARPDLSIDGVVELERLNDVLYIGRPAYGEERSTVSIFKIEEGGGYASRVKVTLGRASVNSVEVKSGLKEGDRVILSDMAQYDGTDRVRIR